jgi:uncharacterized membrane protein (UPF0127 family)
MRYFKDLKPFIFITVFIAILLPVTKAIPSPNTNIQITPKGKDPITFQLESAVTAAEKERGLMYRTKLRYHGGMIFYFNPPQEVIMWMKHTLIPLDMLFIANDNTISNLIANAHPNSLKLVPSQGVVKAVIEIQGGSSKRLGIAVGDHVTLQ